MVFSVCFGKICNYKKPDESAYELNPKSILRNANSYRSLRYVKWYIQKCLEKSPQLRIFFGFESKKLGGALAKT